MIFTEFAELVARMRRAQQRFFRTNNPDALGEAKALERKVDLALAEIARPPELFDDWEGRR